METNIEYHTVERELEIYKFVRKNVGRLLDRNYIEKQLDYTKNILSTEFRSIIKKYIVTATSDQNKVYIMDLILMKIEHLGEIPDESIIPFYRVEFVDSDQIMAVVNKDIIPFWMLKEYGGFIPEFPNIE